MRDWRLVVQRTLHILLLLVFVAGLAPRAGQAQESAPGAERASLEARVDTLLAQMSVADRVGQLFLIGFEGNNTGFDSDIAELIYGYRVGGVLLDPANGNFVNERGVDTPVQVARLANRLQALAYGVLLPADQGVEAATLEEWPPAGAIVMERVTNVPPVNLPLLVAVEQNGDGLPGTALRRGFTPLPSTLALGATWNPELVGRVGQIVGREAAAVGVNLLLGPALDVLVQPRADAVGALGLNLFGGDPYWVAQMGRAYIGGVHTGSQGRIATVARHFPGAGDADRLPDQEVAIVQRTLQELQRVTFPPFLAVTRNPSSLLRPDGDPAAVEGLMSAHIRYSAFQGPGSGRNTPLSLSPELEGVLAREGFADWRNAGGLLVSNVLGAPAIRRHYDATLTDFPYRRVALDAFTAGHDLLVLDQFSLDDRWESEKQNIKETIGFFQDRYVRDPDFAAQVDASVRRILALKLRLYGWEALADAGDGPSIPATAVLVTEDDLAVLGGEVQAEALATVTQVARESFTVLAPDPATAPDTVAVAPQPEDRLLIITDSRLTRECDGCLAEATIGPDELAAIIGRLYGPEGTGQLAAEQIVSLTFSDLAEWLAAEPVGPAVGDATNIPMPAETTLPESGDEPAPDAPPLLDKHEKTRLLVDEADWIIFAMLDVDGAGAPASTALKQFLSRVGAQPAGKRLVVLALHAPYFLDTTEVSKLSGYYAVYGKTQPFLETAVRALFRAFTPAGAPPVSVPGTRFAVLSDRLVPDPGRPIDLLVTKPDGEVVAGDAAQEPAGLPVVEAGNWLRIQAGPIVDRNGKPVRNGTPVEVALVYEEDGSRDVEIAMTQNAMAVRELALNRGGTAHVTARSGDAVSNEVLTLSVQGGVAVIAPGGATALPPAPTAESAASPSSTVAVEEAVVAPVVIPRMNLVALAVTLLVMLATLGLLLVVQVRILPRATLVNNLLWALNCGLAGYILYGLGWLPGGAWLHDSLRVWGGAPVVLIAMLLPLIWLQLRTSE